MFGVLVFLAVLSLLVFVHELGHFLGAKACGIYVDRFSVGMPPRLFGLRIGETDYCIGLLPIGGYVKMAGQEDAPLTEEEREQEYGHVPPERWFNNKPVWQRIFVSLAGPFMNLVLGVILYGVVTAMGGEVPEWELNAKIGLVDATAPAATAPLYLKAEDKAFEAYQGAPDATGWQTGDTILTLDGRGIDNISDLAIAAVLGGEGKQHYAEIERINPDNSTTLYISPIAPKLLDGEDFPRFGVAPFETTLVEDVIAATPASEQGLQQGDIIERANGDLVDRYTFVKKIEAIPEGEAVELAILRGDKRFSVTMTPQTIGRFVGLAITPGVDPATKENWDASPIVAGVSEEFAEASGIQRKDIITKVNGQPATRGLLYELEKDGAGKEINITVERPAILFGVLQKAETLDLTLPAESVRAIGVALGARTIFHREPASRIVPEAFRQSYLAVERVLMTVKALVMRDVSPKNIGGPVMIFDVTTKAAKVGFQWLLKIVAFISINLCVFNLLPLPVLDGGLIVIHGYEGLRGKPLSMKFQERYQQAGLIFIVAMMLFVTWNDIGRLVQRVLP